MEEAVIIHLKMKKYVGLGLVNGVPGHLVMLSVERVKSQDPGCLYTPDTSSHVKRNKSV